MRMISPFFHPHRCDPNSLLDTTLLYCPISLILTVCPERGDSLSAARFLLAARFLSVARFLSATHLSLGDASFSWRPGFRLVARFSLRGTVLARWWCFLLGLGFLLSTDFGSWLLLLAARSGLYSLSILFLSPFSFTELKILLTTGLEYGLPYIILGKIFF